METYKTDIEWFKELPVGWSSFRFVDYIDLKHGFQFRDFDFTDEGIKIVKITQLNQDGSLDLSDCSFIEAKRLDEFNDILIKEGDILMALTGGTIGKIIRCAEIKEPLLQNYRVGNFIPFRGLDKGFLFYLLSSQLTLDQIDYYINRNGQPNIGKENFKRMFFPFPPKPEQTAIANYLDRKTTTIDKKTALLQQKIETYKKLRKAIINKAVTKGLDNKVDLKESEIDWIGKIPKHWEVKRFKEFAQTIKGKNLEFYETQVENSLPNLSLEYLRNDSVVFETYVKADDKNLIANENDLIIIWDGAGVGEILYGKKGVISSTTAKLKFSNIINAQFFSFLRFNVEYRLKNIPTGMGIPHLNPNELKNFMCPIPPIKEQRQIAEYLDQKTATIDKIVANLQTQITTLQHLRKVLINDAVTGKIKVV